MYVAKYLLSIEEFLDAENGEALLARAFSYVDEERERKARRVRPGPGRAASLGAGLLLQAAVREAAAAAGMCVPEGGGMGMAGDGPWNKPSNKPSNKPTNKPTNKPSNKPNNRPSDKPWNRPHGLWADGKAGLAGVYGNKNEIKQYSVNELLEFLYGTSPIPLAYVYGKEGKPYFRDLPFYFNLSHSGEYVLCAVSTEEIGADIQQHCGKDVGKLARRFFPEREWAALEQAGEERERLFYRLWARKEAYGKLTGKGIADALGADLLPDLHLNLSPDLRLDLSPGLRLDLSSDLLPGEGLPEKAVPGGAEATVLPEGRGLLWEEYGIMEAYSIAFCRFC